ncbi:MAG: hypothetical protein HZA06_03205 [Nitrospirae bacterium]|nr:hypothetical protein [Nitrospirota bacterium]
MDAGIMKVGLEEIYKILPHRYPFLFIDNIINLVPGKRATGIKGITSNEYILLLSPSLIIEAIAQVAGITLSYNKTPLFSPAHSLIPPLIRGDRGGSGGGDYSGYLIEVKDFSFFEEIHIGDRLFLDIELTQRFGNLFRFMGTARAGDRIIAKGEISIAVVQNPGQ